MPLNTPIRTRKRYFILASVFLSLFLTSLACQIDLGGPELPGPPIPTQIDAAQTLKQLWESAALDASGAGQVTVLINEIQLTSLLAQRMETKDNPVLQEPQVYLRNNAILIYGITESGPFKASVLLGIKPVVDTEGELSFDLTTAEFGPIPAPSALKDTVSAILTEAFTGTIGSLATGIRVKTIAISEGEMAIIGELR